MALPRYIPSYTYDEYSQWQGDWELWSGVPVSMSPSPKREHQRICAELVHRLKLAAGAANCDNCEILIEIDWKITDDTVLRPDLLIVCNHPQSDFVEETPPFVCEISSESTRQRDLVYKRDMYERLGVLYYLIVDPRNGSYILLRNGADGFTESQDSAWAIHQDCVLSPDLTKL